MHSLSKYKKQHYIIYHSILYITDNLNSEQARENLHSSGLILDKYTTRFFKYLKDLLRTIFYVSVFPPVCLASICRSLVSLL